MHHAKQKAILGPQLKVCATIQLPSSGIEFPGYPEIDDQDTTNNAANSCAKCDPSMNLPESVEKPVMDVVGDRHDPSGSPDGMLFAEQNSNVEGEGITGPEADDQNVDEIASNTCAKCDQNKNPPESVEKPVIDVVVGSHDPGDSPDGVWIQCSACDRWFHIGCVGLEEWEVEFIDDFYCEACAPIHGQSKVRQMVCDNRLNCFDAHEKKKPTEVGTKAWVEEFVTWETSITAPNSDRIIDNYGIVTCDDGADFLRQFKLVTKNELWQDMYVVKRKKGLGLIMPYDGFGAQNVLEIFGADYMVDTIDVYRQTTVKMSLGKFVSHFQKPPEERSRLFNILSLEFSAHDELYSIVRPPLQVSEMSWVDKLWPDSNDPSNSASDAEQFWKGAEEWSHAKPEVNRYCLMGTAGSFTDFHVDFGGSSVWYHVYMGQKIFYVIPPTPTALYEYEKHCINDRHSETFFGSLPLIKENLRRVVVNEGETLMLPSGWIHAVYTPVDSIVFGGNFLHSYNVLMQLKIYKMEKRVQTTVGTDEKFLYPYFREVHWSATRFLLTDLLHETNVDKQFIGKTQFEGLKELLSSLRRWLEEGQSDAKLYSTTLNKFHKELEKQEKRYSPKRGRGSRTVESELACSSKKKTKFKDRGGFVL